MKPDRKLDSSGAKRNRHSTKSGPGRIHLQGAGNPEKRFRKKHGCPKKVG